MNILVLNGSPAGENSITLQTVNYIKKNYPCNEYEVLHVGQQIRRYEKDFAEAKKALECADLIMFAYPVYTFLVPAQLHRFIELIKENDVALQGKYASQITTSKHFYDTTAHRFIRDNCMDLGLKVIEGLSADMEDLLKMQGKKDAILYFRHLLYAVQHDLAEKALPVSETKKDLEMASAPKHHPTKKNRKHIVIVADLSEEDQRLKAMIDRFQQRSVYRSEIVNIHQFPFQGGCLGCFHCAADGKCIYKDRFDDFLREKIQTADATVYAFSIKDHSMGYRFKLFDDRQFCNGHRTVTLGKPVGYLVDGEISKEENLRTVIEARAQVGGNPLAGIACDEYDVDRSIDQMAAELHYSLNNNYTQPANFYGVGGMKIFRDLIWQMQGLMREDHRFYKEHGFYDFPQKKMGTILAMYLVGGLMHNEKLKKKIGDNMTKEMLKPYRKIVEHMELS